MDRADIWMVQSGRSLSLSLKSDQCLGVLSYFVRQELESNKAVQIYVFRLIDDTHPPAAEFFDNAVMRDGLAYHWAGI